jgi:hypothetical protein
MEWQVHRNVQEGSPVLRAFVGFVRYASPLLLVRGCARNWAQPLDMSSTTTLDVPESVEGFRRGEILVCASVLQGRERPEARILLPQAHNEFAPLYGCLDR